YCLSLTDPPPTEIYPLSLHDALPILAGLAPSAYVRSKARRRRTELRTLWPDVVDDLASGVRAGLSLPEALIALAERGPEQLRGRSEEHTSELQSRENLVCRLLLEKKK